MKAAQWDNNQKKAVVNDVPIPEPGPNQFLVKIKSASLCHSDLMGEIRPPSEKPITLGHEGVGHIEKIHPTADAKGFKVGDAIGWIYIIDCCFECDGCQAHGSQCELGTQKIQGFMSDGYFAEYAVVDWRNAIILPEKLDMTRCAPIFCAGITAFNAVDSCNLKAGDWIAIVGTGGLGQFAIQIAKAMNSKVIGIDINDAALEQAKRLGADAVFNTRTNKNYVDEVKKLTGRGVHAAPVFSAARAAFEGAIPIMRPGGTIMVIGIPPGELPFTALDLTMGRYKVKADNTGHPSRMKKAVDFIAEHNILPDVEFRNLEEVPTMLDEMNAGKTERRMAVVF